MSTRTEAVEAALRNFLAATNKTRWFEAARLDAEKALAMPKDCDIQTRLSPDERLNICQSCNGDGFNRRVLPSGRTYSQDCPTCHGKGTL